MHLHTDLGEVYPIGGNKDGSYLTAFSLGSLGAFEINLINVSIQGDRIAKPTIQYLLEYGI